MCLAIPGKIISIEDEKSNLRMGRVSFSGIIKEISLAYVPEATVDDYVLVHAGFAINKIDESEANEVFEYLRQISEMSEEDKIE
jgi:hydrogenase expression/formation protein HypC